MNLRRLAVAFAFVAFLCAIPASPQTQAPPATAKLASVEVTGTTKLTTTQILQTTGLKVGDMVGKEQLQEAANRLAAGGLVSAVNYHFTTDASGVHVTFEVKEAATVPVVFDNFPWFTDDELGAAIREATGSFDGTAPPQGSVLDTMASTLEKLLLTHGVRGKVKHVLTGWPEGASDVVQFSVDGNPVVLHGIEFSDSMAAKSLQVVAQLSDIVGHSYSRLAIALYMVEQVRPVYLGAGYLKVSFGTPTATFSKPASGGQPGGLQVTQPITLGPQYRLDTMTWGGNAAYSTTSLSTMFPFSAGDVVDGNKVQLAWASVIKSYGHIGYMDAQVDAQPTFDDAAGKVSYHAQITEGAQYHMGNLIITGLSLDGEKKFRQAWSLPAGAVFDEAYFDLFTTKIAHPNEAIYGNVPVHYDKADHLLRPNPQTHTIDVLFDFQ